MSTQVTVKAMLNLAGFPDGEVRKVEKTEHVDALLAAGYIAVVPARSEAASGAVEGSVDGVEAPGGSGSAPAPAESSEKAPGRSKTA